MRRKPGAQHLTRSLGQEPEAADCSLAVRAGATAVEGLSELVLGRVVIERNLVPGLQVLEREDPPAMHERGRIAAMVHEAPVATIRVSPKLVAVWQVDMHSVIDLNGVPVRPAAQASIDVEQVAPRGRPAGHHQPVPAGEANHGDAYRPARAMLHCGTNILHRNLHRNHLEFLPGPPETVRGQSLGWPEAFARGFMPRCPAKGRASAR
jgi:hypothetical protein